MFKRRGISQPVHVSAEQVEVLRGVLYARQEVIIKELRARNRLETPTGDKASWKRELREVKKEIREFKKTYLPRN